MNAIDQWLQTATCRLSTNSAAVVRGEILEHFESARESALSLGATVAAAETSALRALGDARTANRQYRSTLLTRAEERVLNQGNWEARAICANGTLKHLLSVLPVLAFTAGVIALSLNWASAGRICFAFCALSFPFAAPMLPIYTPVRSRIFRWVKWLAYAAGLLLVFGAHDALKYSWLIASSFWPVFWSEWNRMSLRRKLPQSRWPKQLYI